MDDKLKLFEQQLEEWVKGEKPFPDIPRDCPVEEIIPLIEAYRGLLICNQDLLQKSREEGAVLADQKIQELRKENEQ